MASKFSKTLRKARKDHNLTQQQLADVLEMTRSTYTYYETGRSNPSGKLILKISAILEVDYSVFMNALYEDIRNNS